MASTTFAAVSLLWVPPAHAPPIVYEGGDAIAALNRTEEKVTRRIVLAVLLSGLMVGTAAAQSCDSSAVGANGKALHGAAKMSFVRKCKRDTCAGKAVSAEGKPLHGAAKNSFLRKCMRGA